MRRTAATALIVALAVVGCTNNDGGAPPGSTFEGLDGAILYQQACAGCHGADLTGTDRGPPFLDAVYAPGHHSDAAFFLATKVGARSHHWNFGRMPPIAGLDDEQIEAIVAFIRAQQRAAGIE